MNKEIMNTRRIELLNASLDRIYSYTTRILPLVNNIGIHNGKISIALFLYHYVSFRKSEEAEIKADNLIDEIWEKAHNLKMPFSFYSGHSGITWGLHYLGKERVIDINTDEVEKYFSFVNTLFLHQTIEFPVQINLQSGIFTNGFFLLSQNKLQSDDLLQKYTYLENIVYAICECERIILKKTAFNNLYLPEITLKLLNSILYFLIIVHKLEIFPHKTNKLLTKIYTDILDILERSDFLDLVVTKQLSMMMRENININFFIDADFIDLHINRKVPKSFKDIVINISEARLYSLLYNDKLILEKVIAEANLNNINELEGLENIIDEIMENDSQSLNTLLGIADGIIILLTKE